MVEPSYSELPSVFFAGDFCRNEVKMATVEAAVLSGLHSARAVQMRVGARPTLQSSKASCRVRLNFRPQSW